MKLKKITALLPSAHTLKKDLKVKEKLQAQVNKEVLEIKDQIQALEGVTNYSGYPLREASLEDGGVMITSAGEEVKRFARVEPSGEKYVALGAPHNEKPQQRLGEFETLKMALRTARDYVAQVNRKTKTSNVAANPETAQITTD